MRALSRITEAAIAELNPRAYYAADVISGRQRWSGSDLTGKAARFSCRYAEQRAKAFAALRRVGGTTVPVEHGRIVTAVRLGVDDYGNTIYDCPGGIYRAEGGAFLRKL